MKKKQKYFLVISAVLHKKAGGSYAGYTPYVKEMNLWLKHVDKVRILAPVIAEPVSSLDMFYKHPDLEFVEVPPLNFTSFKNAVFSGLVMPIIIIKMFQCMLWANHIHLRCPANLGLIGAFIQIFFPTKYKTVKYANNWDWGSKQPVSYRIQQKILRNEFLTKRTKILVYGDWNEKSKNVLPFYTASYSETMRLPVEIRPLSKEEEIRLLFVGTLTKNKRPLQSIQVLEKLRELGYRVRLDLIGGGVLQVDLAEYVKTKNLQDCVHIIGKVNPETVIQYFSKAHFLIFLSMSEGWPKVVAESMWWGCLPVTTRVSCVEQMLGGSKRGVLIQEIPDEAVREVEKLINNEGLYTSMCVEAMKWSRKYTLEKFEEDIVHLLNSGYEDIIDD